MARIDSKTNWVPTDRPAPVDFNRIENNNEQAFNEIDQEKVDRAAAVTSEANARIAADNVLQGNINAESNARISADNNLEVIKVSYNNLGLRLYSTATLSFSDSYIIPAGIYYLYFSLTSGTGSGFFEILNSQGNWVRLGSVSRSVGDPEISYSSIVISDGSNARIRVDSATGSLTYRLLQIK